MNELCEGKLYITIKQYLIELIEKHYLVPNYKLPSENQLSLRFHASRVSARHALNELVAEGIIYKIQGKGSFISKNYLPRTAPLILKKENLDRLMIALLIPGVDSRFYINIIEGVKESLTMLGFQMIVLFTESDSEREKQCILSALSIGCKGIIILPVDNQVYNPEILKLSINHFPIILLDRKFEGLDISYVASNHEHATYKAVKLLATLGHKNIAFISPTPKVASSIVERVKGFERANLESQNALFLSKCYLSDRFNKRKNEMKLFIEKSLDTTAFICEGGNTGLELMNLLSNMARGQKVECIIYDNEYEHYKHLLPLHPIIIDQNPLQIGRDAGVLMEKLIRNPLEKIQILLDNFLIL